MRACWVSADLNPETDGEETRQRHTETQSQGVEAENSVMLLQTGERKECVLTPGFHNPDPQRYKRSHVGCFKPLVVGI